MREFIAQIIVKQRPDQKTPQKRMLVCQTCTGVGAARKNPSAHTLDGARIDLTAGSGIRGCTTPDAAAGGSAQPSHMSTNPWWQAVPTSLADSCWLGFPQCVQHGTTYQAHARSSKAQEIRTQDSLGDCAASVSSCLSFALALLAFFLCLCIMIMSLGA